MVTKSYVVRFIGLSASGKSTLANHLYKNLQDLKCKAFIVDSDTLSKEAGFDLDFSDQESSKNAARAITLASNPLDGTYANADRLNKFEHKLYLVQEFSRADLRV